VNYDIRIKTTAEGQGAQQTADSLKQVTQAANQAKAATAEVAKATDGADKQQSKWTISKQQAAQALGQLKQSIPGLGTAINLLKNPYAAAAGAIATFVLAIKKQIAAQEEAIIASQQLGAAMDTGNAALSRRKRTFNDLEDAAASYEEQLRQLAEEESGIDAQTKAKLADVERGLKQERRAGAARLEVEEAKIDAAVQAGKLSPERAEIARARLRRGEAARIEGLEAGAQEARLGILRGAFETKEKQRVAAETALPAAEAEAGRLAGVAARKKGASEALIAATQAEIAKTEEQRARAERVAADIGLGGPQLVVDVQTGRLVSREEGIASAQAMERAKASELVTLRRTLAEQQEAPGTAERQAAQAQARVQELRKQSIGARRGMLGYLEQGETIAADIQAESTANATIARQAEELRILRERMELEKEQARLRLEAEKSVNKALKDINARFEAEKNR
jgi:hypothetical protein